MFYKQLRLLYTCFVHCSFTTTDYMTKWIQKTFLEILSVFFCNQRRHVSSFFAENLNFIKGASDIFSFAVCTCHCRFSKPFQILKLLTPKPFHESASSCFCANSEGGAVFLAGCHYLTPRDDQTSRFLDKYFGSSATSLKRAVRSACRWWCAAEGSFAEGGPAKPVK